MTKNILRHGKTAGWSACLLLAAALASLSPIGLSARTEKRAPVYVFFLDQTDRGRAGPSFNGLDERRRGPIFKAALQAAADAGELPPVTVVNSDISLPTTTLEKPHVPPGATLLRVFLTQWSTTRLGGFADSELLCRFFVEVVRDGKTVAKLGPYLGDIQYDVTNSTTPDAYYRMFGASARQGIDQMARDLPR